MATGINEGLVLVTGASGFIATHVVQLLQREGYRVRGTVRSVNNEAKVGPIRNLCPDAKYPVELVEADLTDADSWKSAVQDCVYVLHMASPFPGSKPRDENELIKPAVDGTLNVLKACAEAKCVKRVVLTSSVVAVSNYPHGDPELPADHVYTEENWTNPSEAQPYEKSKTLAEKAAWDFVKDLPEDQKFELAVVNPCYVLGPVLCGTFGTSMELVKALLERKMPALPKMCFTVTDVRDVALAHLRCMTLPEAADQRHLILTGNYWMREIAEILSAEFKRQGYNVPSVTAPYVLVWAKGLFDPLTKMILPSVGKKIMQDNTRMKTVLGIEPRNFNETIIDMAYSMIETGHVKKSKKYKGAPKSSD